MNQPKKEKAKKISIPQEDIDFIRNWYQNRKSILGKDGKPIPLPKTSFNYNPVISEEVFSDKNILGAFYPSDKHIGLSPYYEDSPGTLSHEVNHYIQDQFSIPDFIKYISDPIENIEGDNPKTEEYGKMLKGYGNYLLDPSEVHSRLMQFRKESGFKPGQIIDEKTYEKAIENTNRREKFMLDMFDDEQMINLLNKTVQVEDKTDLQVAKYGGTIKGNGMKKKTRKTSGYPTYEFGTYIEDPQTALAQNQINIAKARLEAQNNPWVKGLDIFGNLAMQVGSSMMNQGMANGEGADGKGVAGFLSENNGIFQSGLNMAGGYANSSRLAYGGNTKNIPVEVEGQEVGQTPNGTLLDFQGPSHENGGIPISLPVGTEMYSKRIKVDGVSMANRKKKREKKTMSLEELIEQNGKDTILKNTLNRTMTTNKMEEDSDNQIQEMVKAMLEPTEKMASGGKLNFKSNSAYHNWLSYVHATGVAESTPGHQEVSIKGKKHNVKHAYGDTVGGPLTEEEMYLQRLQSIPSFMNNFGQRDNSFSTQIDASTYPSMNTTYGSKSWDLDNNSIPDSVQGTGSAPMNKDKESGGSGMKDYLGGITAGDALGIFGNLYQAFQPMKNTLANRAGDTPNINAFRDFGKDALTRMDESKGYIAGQRDSALRDLELARNTASSRARNSARGVNTLRALDLASQAGLNKAQGDIYNQFSQQMMSILGQEAGLENAQDQAVMQGEYMRDLADRQDRDNFYTQMAQDIMTKGEGISRTGKSLNDIKSRNVAQDFMNQMFGYVQGDIYSGNISGKKGKESTPIEYQTQYPELTSKEKQNGEYTKITNPLTQQPFKTKEEYELFQMILNPNKKTTKK